MSKRKLLVTSLHDYKYTSFNRLHHILKNLSEYYEITIISTDLRNTLSEEEKQKYDTFYKDDYFLDWLDKIENIYIGSGSPMIQQISIQSVKSILNSLDLSNYDIHLNYQSLLPGYYITKHLKKFDIKTVFDVADDMVVRNKNSPLVPKYMKNIVAWTSNFMMKKNIEVADYITYVSPQLKDIFEIPEWKSSMIGNGVDTKLYVCHDNCRNEFGFRDEDIIIGFTGVIRWWDDFDTVFKSLAALQKKYNKIKLLIISCGMDIPQVQKMLDKYGILNCSKLLEFVPCGEMPKILSCMDICIIPFRQTRDCMATFPMKMLEYMACGKPIISTDLLSVREIVGDRVLYASSVEDYIREIEKLIKKDDDLINEMCIDNVRFVKEQYTWKKISEEFIKIFSIINS